MPCRLKSNIKYAWNPLLFCGIGLVMLYAGFAVLLEVTWPEAAFLVLWILISLACFIGYLVDFLLKWQWVTVDAERISVHCVLFQINSIPLAGIKRCWVCKHCLMMNFGKAGTNVYRDCIVIDRNRSRRGHTIQDGYSRRKQKYIILPDTPENRGDLAQFGIPIE